MVVIELLKAVDMFYHKTLIRILRALRLDQVAIKGFTFYSEYRIQIVEIGDIYSDGH